MARGQYREHNGPKQLCPKIKHTNGEQCKREAGYQTDHLGEGYCRQHGGMAPGQRKNAARVIAGRIAERESRALVAAEKEIDPEAALLWAVRLSAGAVEWLQKQINTNHGYPPGTDDLDREKLRAMWVELYGEERDRLVRASKAAIDAGIASRMVELEENQGRFVADAFHRTLARLDLTPTQLAEAPRLLREELLAIPAPPAPTLKLVSTRANR
jgi:hypothetical protein